MHGVLGGEDVEDGKKGGGERGNRKDIKFLSSPFTPYAVSLFPAYQSSALPN